MTDHYLSKVLRHCLDQDEYSEEIDGIFEALSLGLKESHGYAGNLHATFEAIAETATGRFLDCIFFASALEDHEREAVFSEQQERNLALKCRRFETHALVLSMEILTGDWCCWRKSFAPLRKYPRKEKLC